MSFTADEVANINNAALENYIDKGKVWTQNVQNKPMLAAFNENAGRFSGGNENVSFAVKSGHGGGSLVGYSGDDVVSYYNPTGIKRARFPWKEHHIGIVVTHTELKTDGIEVTENGANQTTSEVDGREAHALANLLEDKNETLGEDYAYSLDRLVHGDGSSDAKALAGIGSIILPSPALGTTGTISRAANSWWRNRAATAAYASDGGQAAISSASTGGGVLITFLQKEWLQLARYRNGSTRSASSPARTGSPPIAPSSARTAPTRMSAGAARTTPTAAWTGFRSWGRRSSTIRPLTISACRSAPM